MEEADSGSAVPQIKAKLTIGAPDDTYEREADRVADSLYIRFTKNGEPENPTAVASWGWHDLQLVYG